MKTTCKTLAVLLVLTITIYLMPTAAFAEDVVWSGNAPDINALQGDNIRVTISGMPIGVLVVPENTTVSISGTVTGATSMISINIGAGSTVIWNNDAQYTGSARWLMYVRGSGTFKIIGGTIENA